MHNQLKLKADKDKKYFSKLSRARFVDSPISLFTYISLRSIRPIFNNLLTRLITLIEIYLLYNYFYYEYLPLVITVIFLLVSSRQIFQGVSQYYREKLVAADLEKNTSDWSHNYYFLIKTALIYGLLIALFLQGFVSYQSQSITDFIYAAIWLILFPLELVSYAIWTAAYTQTRVYRTFWLVVLLRLLPLFAIIFLSDSLGFLAYPLGLLISRALENIYLLKRAYSKLKDLGYYPIKPKLSFNIWLANTLSKDIWQRISFILPAQLYTLILAILLATHNQSLLYTYFIIHHISSIFLYPIHRATQAIGYDIFTALKFGNINWAKYLYDKVIKANIILTISTLIILTAIGAVFFKFLLFAFGEDTFYLIYIIPLILVLAFYRSHVTVHLWTGTEVFLAKYALLIFFLLALPLQALIIFYYRGNFAVVISIEIFTYFLAMLPMLGTKLFNLSTISYDHNNQDSLSLIPEYWARELKQQALLDKDRMFLFIGLIKPFNKSEIADSICEKIANLIPNSHSPVITKVSQGGYLFALSNINTDSAEQIFNKILRDFSGYLYSLIFFKANSSDTAISSFSFIASQIQGLKTPIPKSIIFQAPTAGWQASKEIRSIANSMLQNENQILIKDLLSDIKVKNFVLEDLIKQRLSQIGLDKKQIEEIPRIQFINSKVKSFGIQNADFSNFCYSLFIKKSQQNILPKRRKPYIVFATPYEPIMIMNLESINDNTIKKNILDLSYALLVALWIDLLSGNND